MMKALCFFFAGVCLPLQVVAGEPLAPKAETEITRVIAKELEVLTQTIPSYAVTQMPATKALEHLWVKTLGRKPETISFKWLSERVPERLIDLELHDVPALQVISYIADIAGARWRIRGIDGVAQVFELEAIEVADDTDSWVAVVLIELNDKGTQNLGLKAGMDSSAVLKRLQAYGVQVDQEKNSTASFNAVTGMLAALVSIRDVEFVKSLCRLANAGLLVPQP